MVQLVITFMDDQVGYFTVEHSWVIKTRDGVSSIVIKEGDPMGLMPGMPRTVIPLNNVRYYRVERLDA